MPPDPDLVRAVIFDLGGVVMPSPLDVFRTYEAANGLPHRFVSEVVVNGGEHGAWSRFERGELDLDAFAEAFDAECAAAGGAVVTADLLAAIHTGAGPRDEMVAAIRTIRAHGLRTAALTNNWPDPEGNGVARRAGLGDLFDVVVESAVEGLRKPDVRIYELTCDAPRGRAPRGRLPRRPRHEPEAGARHGHDHHQGRRRRDRARRARSRARLPPRAPAPAPAPSGAVMELIVIRHGEPHRVEPGDR